MPVSVSTDLVRPSERQAYWTEAICRSFANVETRPLRSGGVTGHFELIEIGNAKVARFDTSPQSYSRNARLVNSAGSNDFMFDFQMAGRSWMTQGAREGSVHPGYGVLYDARRPFEDRLDSHFSQSAEVLIVTVPAASFLATFPDAERLCAMPILLSGAVGRSITRLVRSTLVEPANESMQSSRDEGDIITYLSALLRHARDGAHGLNRRRLFTLVDIHLRQNLGTTHCPAALATKFGISERTFHRIFADRNTTFERHLLCQRVERLRDLLSQSRWSHISIVGLALECGFADAAHASRTFKTYFHVTPRDYRAGVLHRREERMEGASPFHGPPH